MAKERKKNPTPGVNKLAVKVLIYPGGQHALKRA